MQISAADERELRAGVQSLTDGAESIRRFDGNIAAHQAALPLEEKEADELCNDETLNGPERLQKFITINAKTLVRRGILHRAPGQRGRLVAAFNGQPKILGDMLRGITGIHRKFDFENAALSPLDAAALAGREVERILSGQLSDWDEFALARQRRR